MGSLKNIQGTPKLGQFLCILLSHCVLMRSLQPIHWMEVKRANMIGFIVVNCHNLGFINIDKESIYEPRAREIAHHTKGLCLECA